eukprot:TRINITY_DN4550_c7_g1_i1.p1 TRINITY_DN4550_c7_g1~~TRINITY_DN4550_c7_g1_i1.p1  ORF type:complete len:525 (+),score=148.01 TRINITY_DN4550_c7_g1_i1:60-1577(+)
MAYVSLPPPRPLSAPPGRPRRPPLERPALAARDLWGGLDVLDLSGCNAQVKGRPSSAASRHRQHLQATATVSRKQWAPRAKGSHPRRAQTMRYTGDDLDVLEDEALRGIDALCMSEFTAWTEGARDRELQSSQAAERLEYSRLESRRRQMVLVAERRGRQQLLHFGQSSVHRLTLQERNAARRRSEVTVRENRRRLLLQIDQDGSRELLQRADRGRSAAAGLARRLEAAERAGRQSCPQPLPAAIAHPRTAADIAADARRRRERRERLLTASRELCESDSEPEHPLGPYLELEYLMSAEQQLLRRAAYRKIEEEEGEVRLEIDRDEILTYAGLCRTFGARKAILEDRQTVWRSDLQTRAQLLLTEATKREDIEAEWAPPMQQWAELERGQREAIHAENLRRLLHLNATVSMMLGVSQEARRSEIYAGEEDARDRLAEGYSTAWSAKVEAASLRASSWASRRVGGVGAAVREDALERFKLRMEERRAEEEAIQSRLRQRQQTSAAR